MNVDTCSIEEVMAASLDDDLDKADIACAMKDVKFLARDDRVTNPKDPDGPKISELKPMISVPHKGKRIRLEFSPNGFRQFATSRLGIPHQYLAKCPASLAKEQVEYWKATMADSELLIRCRLRDDKTKPSYVRAFLPGSYVRMDNTPLLGLINDVAVKEKRHLSIWRYDLPDNSMHLKILLPDKVNMGTSRSPDDVHLGFHIGSSETGNRSTTFDVMQFRVVCTNGIIDLVDGKRMVSVQHRGDIDIKQVREQIAAKIGEVISNKGQWFGRFESMKDSKPMDPLKELQQVWSRFQLPAGLRNRATELLTTTYTGGTRWDIINVITELSQLLADNPDTRVKMEEAAGRYMSLPQPLIGVTA